ncbi:MAG: hypothetical protein AABX71_03390 [Nanoarchaeota archaeon]
MAGAEGKIAVSGFKLDASEKAIVNEVVENYARKIEEKFGFKEIMLRLKKSRHGKAFHHEIQGTLIVEDGEKQLKAEATDYNLFAALSQVFEKLMREAEHGERTKRQIRK